MNEITVYKPIIGTIRIDGRREEPLESLYDSQCPIISIKYLRDPTASIQPIYAETTVFVPNDVRLIARAKNNNIILLWKDNRTVNRDKTTKNLLLKALEKNCQEFVKGLSLCNHDAKITHRNESIILDFIHTKINCIIEDYDCYKDTIEG